MFLRRTAILLGTVSTLGFGASLPAMAQADQPSGSATGPEEIVVTARRREERAQTVPLAITAFSPATLQEHSIENFQDLQYSVPSLSFVNAFRSGIAAAPRLRGLPGVVSYFSEVPEIIGNQTGDSQTVDLESLQVLKGPQGTLFGQNTTGGAILFQPKKPTNNFEGFVQEILGDYSWNQFTGAVNVPIVADKLLVRVAGERDERDGFTKVLSSPGLALDNRDSWYGRVGITFRPTDDIENYAVADYNYVHTNGSSEILALLNPSKLPASNSGNFTFNNAPYQNGQAILAEQQALGARTIIGFDPVFTKGGVPISEGFNGPLEKAQNIDVADILRWDINDDITFRNILGYIDSKQLLRNDFDGSPLVTQNFDTAHGWNTSSSGAGAGAGISRQYTEEAQVLGKALDGKLQYQVGTFLKYQSQGPSQSTVVSQGSFLVATGGSGSTRTQAVYAQGTYDMSGLSDILDGLKFTGGYRYNWDWGSSAGYTSLINIAGLGPVNICVSGKAPTCTLAADAHFHSPGWTLSLDYAIDPTTLVYVRSSKGYRPGGFTPTSPDPADQSFQPETLVDVEVGIKSDWQLFGVRARTNADLYQGWYSNIQENVVAVTHVQGVPQNTSVTENAASADVEGAEFEGAVFPIRDLELRGNFAFNHNVLTEFNSAFFGQLNGLSFADFPKIKYTLGFTYHIPIEEDWGELSLTGDFNWQSYELLAVNNSPATSPGHQLVNWRVDWNNVMQQPFDLGFFMTNATDSLFPVGGFGSYTSQGFTSYSYNEPRMWGFQLRYRFGGPDEEPAAAPAAYVPPPVQAPMAAPKSYLVFFDFNKSDLTPQAVSIVGQAAANAGPAKVTQLTVTGHTDTVGSDAYNMRLSRRRAESVAAQLEKDGIASSEIQIVAKGKRDLLVPTADGVKEPRNRRVQIVYDGGPSS
jgi:iron complex outermembrane receptor protein